LPGVTDLLDALDAAGVPAGIASSSEVTWLERHLGRLGLLDRFAVLAGVDRVNGVGKPAPDSYLLACRELDALPARSVALEDSAHGVAAARAAGMAVVAVPSRITRLTSLTDADLIAGSLTELTVTRLDSLVSPARRAPAE
ncbi:MAG: HAD-IA family hydrolase, partial [Actinomycetota bacterium]|nr:HAD-IA family hydrolase [Actinomycetota bacterium]